MKPKITPEAILSPILARWQAMIPGIAFAFEEDGDDVVIVARILGQKTATARIRREFLDFGSEEVAPHANRVIGSAIGSVI